MSVSTSLDTRAVTVLSLTRWPTRLSRRTSTQPNTSGARPESHGATHVPARHVQERALRTVRGISPEIAHHIAESQSSAGALSSLNDMIVTLDLPPSLAAPYGPSSLLTRLPLRFKAIERRLVQRDTPAGVGLGALLASSSLRPPTTDRAMRTVAVFMSMSVQRRARSSPRRAPVRTASRRKDARSLSFSSACMISLATTSVLGIVSSCRCTRDGLARVTGLVAIQPQRTAWFISRRRSAWTWWTLWATSGPPSTLPRRWR